MTASERLNRLLSGQSVDRPPFIPAIYDLKPAFLKLPSHTFGQSEQEIIDALTFEAEELQADALTVGYDIYNVEAEAVGCRVRRDPGIWMPEIEGPILRDPADVGKLKVPVGPAGRMELFVRAAEALLEKYGQQIPVRGGISGPFSMASKLMAGESLLTATMTDPEGLSAMLSFCTETIKVYARSFADIGAGVIVFDSFAAPPMVSPEIYHEVVFPFHKDIMNHLEALGVYQRSLIIGGNTLPIIQDLIKCGATQLLLDYTIGLEDVKLVMQENLEMAFRVNIAPALFREQNTIQLETTLQYMLNTLSNQQNLIIGTGILPPETSVENILLARKQILDNYA